MNYIMPLLLIVGGILAISNLIVSKKPSAKEMIDKLVPYQAGIGIALLVFGIYNVVTSLGATFQFIKFVPLLGVAILAMIICSVLLGFMFGMPQIAKWMPGNAAAEQKGLALSAKLAPFQLIIGLVGIGSTLIFFLYRFGILNIAS